MAKILDITDKLSFDENPVIAVKGKMFEVNSDAETMLKMMEVFKEKGEVEASVAAYELMFSEAAREEISKMKLPFKDFMILIESAMSLIQGEDEQEEVGKSETPSMIL